MVGVWATSSTNVTVNRDKSQESERHGIRNYWEGGEFACLRSDCMEKRLRWRPEKEVVYIKSSQVTPLPVLQRWNESWLVGSSGKPAEWWNVRMNGRIMAWKRKEGKWGNPSTLTPNKPVVSLQILFSPFPSLPHHGSPLNDRTTDNKAAHLTLEELRIQVDDSPSQMATWLAVSAPSPLQDYP